MGEHAIGYCKNKSMKYVLLMFFMVLNLLNLDNIICNEAKHSALV